MRQTRNLVYGNVTWVRIPPSPPIPVNSRVSSHQTSMQPERKYLPTVTVIVCTRDRPALLKRCLEALSAQKYDRFDVLVVDNASTQPVRDLCEQAGVTWLWAPVPGLTRARNMGARQARSEIIAYIDDDAIVEEGWLQAMASEFSDPAVGAVTGRVRYMKAIANSRSISDEEAPADRARPRAAFDRTTANWFCKACFGGIGDGGNMAFRRDLIAAEVPFDERLGRGQLLDSGDEHVVFASLIARGHRIAHSPQAIVRHPAPATPSLLKARRLLDMRSSIAYLMFLWREFPTHRSEILGFLRRAVFRRTRMLRVRLSDPAGLSLREAMRAALGGILLYRKARRDLAANLVRVRSHGAEDRTSFDQARVGAGHLDML